MTVARAGCIYDAIMASRALMRCSLFTAVGTTVTTTYFDVGVLLTLATEPMDTSGLWFV